MTILENLPTFELATIIAGLLSGILFPILPKPESKHRPQGAIWCFALAFGCLGGLLPIAADSPRFPMVALVTLIAAAIGYGSSYALMRETESPTLSEPELKPVTLTDSSTRHAA